MSMETVTSHEERKWHVYQRFLYVSKLRAKVPLDNVIFMDGNQLWPDGFILVMVLSCAPKTSSHWYSKAYKPQTSPINYDHNAIDMDDIRGRKNPEIIRFQHGGPVGSI